MDREELNEYLTDENPNALFADGFDEAILGYTQRMNQPPLVAYSVDKIIEILMERDEMTYEEAMEYFDFNIGGGWVGEGTPIWIRKEA
jgi:hypothetical protein